MSAQDNLNPQQFFHGTTHSFRKGDILTPEGARASGAPLNSFSGDYVYYSGKIHEAAEYAMNGIDEDHPTPHIYQVEPVSGHEEDPVRHENEEDAYRAKAAKVVRQVK